MRLLRQLCAHLFQYDRLQTTLPRAKELSRYAEKVITFARRAVGTDGKMKVFERVGTEQGAVRALTILKERYAERPGGYTRVWKAGRREGDNAPMAIIELVDNHNDMKKAFRKPLT